MTLLNGVSDTADHWREVSMTAPINIGTAFKGDPS
jgi:hypothetical protein